MILDLQKRQDKTNVFTFDVFIVFVLVVALKKL